MDEAGVEMVALPRADWEALVDRLDQLEQVVGSGRDERVSSSAGPEPAAMPDRRAVLRRGAVLAAGAAAGAAAFTAGLAPPAAAADGDNLVLGATNSATETTALTVTAPADPISSTPGFSVTGQQGLDALHAYAYGGGVGVSVIADDGVAFRAASENSLAVGAGGGTYGVAAGGGTAALHLVATPSTAPPPARSDAHVAGEIDVDDQATLWLCVAPGTPGSWVRLGALGAAGAFTVLPSSVRVYDSRSGQPPSSVGPKAPLVGGAARTVDVTANHSGVPVDASAASLNLTVVPREADGYLSAYKAGVASPGTSTLNWGVAATPVANGAVVALGGGAIDLLANASADVIVDVIGYYR